MRVPDIIVINKNDNTEISVGTMVLNAVLAKVGLSVKSLSERLGMSRPQKLYDIQKGKTKFISAEIAVLIHKEFGIDLYWLLTGEYIEAKKDIVEGGVNSYNEEDHLSGFLLSLSADLQAKAVRLKNLANKMNKEGPGTSHTSGAKETKARVSNRRRPKRGSNDTD